MKKNHTIKRNEHFNLIIKEGKKKSNKYYIVYFLPSSFFNINEYHIGVSVGKKIGNAPVRNYEKRVIREIIRNNEHILNKYFYVIICTKNALGKRYEEKEKALVDLIGGIK